MPALWQGVRQSQSQSPQRKLPRRPKKPRASEPRALKVLLVFAKFPARRSPCNELTSECISYPDTCIVAVLLISVDLALIGQFHAQGEMRVCHGQNTKACNM